MSDPSSGEMISLPSKFLEKEQFYHYEKLSSGKVLSSIVGACIHSSFSYKKPSSFQWLMELLKDTLGDEQKLCRFIKRLGRYYKDSSSEKLRERLATQQWEEYLERLFDTLLIKDQEHPIYEIFGKFIHCNFYVIQLRNLHTPVVFMYNPLWISIYMLECDDSYVLLYPNIKSYGKIWLEENDKLMGDLKRSEMNELIATHEGEVDDSIRELENLINETQKKIKNLRRHNYTLRERREILNLETHPKSCLNLQLKKNILPSIDITCPLINMSSELIADKCFLCSATQEIITLECECLLCRNCICTNEIKLKHRCIICETRSLINSLQNILIEEKRRNESLCTKCKAEPEPGMIMILQCDCRLCIGCTFNIENNCPSCGTLLTQEGKSDIKQFIENVQNIEECTLCKKNKLLVCNCLCETCAPKKFIPNNRRCTLCKVKFNVNFYN